MTDSKAREQDIHLLIRSVGLNTIIHPLATFGVSIIVARSLGPDGRGGYGVLVACIAVFPLLVCFGLDYATRFFCAHGSVGRTSLLRTISLASALLGTSLSAAVILTWWIDSSVTLIIGELGTLGIASLSLALFFATPTRFWSSYLAGQERYGYITWGITASFLVQAVAILAFWRFVTLSLDLAAAALALQAVFLYILFPALSWNDLRKAFSSPMLSIGELIRMIKFGTWMYISSILGLANTQLIVFLLSTLSSLHETGLYTSVIGPANFLLLFGAPLGTVLATRATKRIGNSNFSIQVAVSLRLLFYITVSAGLVGLVAAPTIIPGIFGDEFIDAVAPFCILLPGLVALAEKHIMVQYLKGIGKPRWSTAVDALNAVMCIGLAFALIPGYGATGAAIAVTSAHLCSTLLTFHAFMRFSGLKPKELFMPRTSDLLLLGRLL